MGNNRIIRVRWLVACVVAVLVVMAPDTAQGATPNRGAWESGGNAEPRVAFDVRGPARRRLVLRVSVPITCRGEPATLGWAWTDSRSRLRRGGRFAASGLDYALRGRFVTRNRAEVSVRMTDPQCKDTRHYVVLRHRRRVRVREGEYLALVGAGLTPGPLGGGIGAIHLRATAFGRMLRIDFFEGSVAGTCADGTQRLMPLTAPEGDADLSAPIRPSGQFDIAQADESATIDIAGTADGTSIAANANFTAVLPDGTSCEARGLALVGALEFPSPTGGEASSFPGPAEAAQAGRRA
jgi:hypothetical protein